MIDAYGLNDFVSFLAYIPNDHIASYYTAADIFVLPSIVDRKGDTEGLGVVLLEANACKTPVIGSGVGGIPDVIRDGENGYLVEQKKSQDLAEKIMKLAGDEKLRKQMGDTGRLIIEEYFNWNHQVKRIMQIYDSLLT